MRLIDIDVARTVVCVCVSVYVLGTRVSCAKTAEPIVMPFEWLNKVCKMKYYLMGVHVPPREGAILGFVRLIEKH